MNDFFISNAQAVMYIFMFMALVVVSATAIAQYQQKVDIKRELIISTRDLQQQIFKRDKYVLSLEKEMGSLPSAVIPEIPREELEKMVKIHMPRAYKGIKNNLTPIRLSSYAQEAIVNSVVTGMTRLLDIKNEALINSNKSFF